MISIKLETVTPEMAQEWLKLNVRNRGLRPGLKEKYLRDRLNGAWLLTHQPIAMSPNMLVDGQHRLTMVLDSGKPLDMFVGKYETDEEAMEAMVAIDTGAPRAVHDVLTLSGTVPQNMSKSVVAVVRVLMKSGFAGVKRTTTTASDVSAVYFKEHESINWSINGLTDPANANRFNAQERAAFALGHMLDPSTMESLANEVLDFFEAREEGAGASSVAAAFCKAENQLRFRVVGISNLNPFRLCLRLVQAAIKGEEAPKMLKAVGEIETWFIEKIQERREAAQPIAAE